MEERKSYLNRLILILNTIFVILTVITILLFIKEINLLHGNTGQYSPVTILSDKPTYLQISDLVSNVDVLEKENEGNNLIILGSYLLSIILVFTLKKLFEDMRDKRL